MRARRLFTNSKHCSFFLWHKTSDWKNCKSSKLQIYKTTKLQIFFSITFISSLVSSSSEGEMDGFTVSLSSTKIDNWEFSFCLPASQCCQFLKQSIKRHPPCHHLQRSNHSTSTISCFPRTIETRRQVPIQLFFSLKRVSYFHLQ